MDTMEKRLEILKQKKESAMLGGGAELIAKQHAKGKLTARERISLLVDKDSFIEQDLFYKGTQSTNLTAEAVVTGSCLIDNRPALIYSQDFTVRGGSLGEIHGRKILNILDKALEVRVPVIGINDSAGGRIGDKGAIRYNDIFCRNSLLSGVVPQISLILGPCAGGAVYSPALTDFIFMVRGISLMFITGPDVIKAVIGEEVTQEQLGNPEVHATITGLAHFVANNEEECMQLVRKLLSYLPQNYTEQPPTKDLGDDPNRIEPELRNIIPVNPAKGYDVRKVIRKIVDGNEFFEVQSRFAPNICIGFARMNKETVGIVANQPTHLAGALDINASVKAARFIRFCDAFNIPLLTFVDCSGYFPGIKQEYGGIIRHGAKLLYAYSEATVPKLTTILRKAYGGSHSAMASLGLRADFECALPTAETGVMGAAGAVNVLHRKELESSDNPNQLRARLIEEYNAKISEPYTSAEHGSHNDIVDPAVLRPYLIRLLRLHKNTRKLLPSKKHGNMPL